MTQTQFYKLNSWAAEDRILRTDFNADNAKLDTALHTLDGKTAALDGKIAAERTYCNDKIAGERTHTDSEIAGHRHFKLLGTATQNAGNVDRITLSPGVNFAAYAVVALEFTLAGTGRFYICPNNCGGTGIVMVNLPVKTQVVLFPMHSADTNALFVSETYATCVNVTNGAMSSFTINTENGGRLNGVCTLRVWGMA